MKDPPPCALVHSAFHAEGLVRPTPDVYRAVLRTIEVYDEFRTHPHDYVPGLSSCTRCGCHQDHGIHTQEAQWHELQRRAFNGKCTCDLLEPYGHVMCRESTTDDDPGRGDQASGAAQREGDPPPMRQHPVHRGEGGAVP